MKGLIKAALACLLCLCSVAHADGIVVIAPSDSALAREFIAVLSEARPADSVALHLMDTDRPLPEATWLVTMGPDALQWRLGHPGLQPTVAAYVSRERLDRFEPEPLPGYVQVLYSNPQPARQIELARLILPRLRSLGLLYSPTSLTQLDSWQDATAQAGVELRLAAVDEPRDLVRGVAELLDTSDVLMALDDPQIYNADNLKTLLLSSYRRGKVLIGPSAAFIPAGSLSTTFSSAADTARSVAEVLADTWAPGRRAYPRHFSVTSNQHVARSLGLPPLDDAALAHAIRLIRVNQ